MACLRGLEGGGGECNLGGIVYINKAENHIHYSFYMGNLVESCLKILFLNMGVFRGFQKGGGGYSLWESKISGRLIIKYILHFNSKLNINHVIHTNCCGKAYLCDPIWRRRGTMRM